MYKIFKLMTLAVVVSVWLWVKGSFAHQVSTVQTGWDPYYLIQSRWKLQNVAQINDLKAPTLKWEPHIYNVSTWHEFDCVHLTTGVKNLGGACNFYESNMAGLSQFLHTRNY